MQSSDQEMYYTAICRQRSELLPAKPTNNRSIKTRIKRSKKKENLLNYQVLKDGPSLALTAFLQEII
jgi:hypothetical protein